MSAGAEPEPTLSPGPVPRHVAIIMDGNGRWAEQRGLERIEGHRRGADSVRTITTACREVGIEALTLYAFSTQNWARPGDEVAGLMQLLYEFLHKELDTLLDNDIRLHAIGEVERLPDFVKARLREVESRTAALDEMTLTLALSYGGREEIVRAAKGIAQDIALGRLEVDAVDEAEVERRMFTHALPQLDLIVRTSGESRLSNFLLWQAAYAELRVTDVLWPDFGRRELFDAIEDFRGRERRYGLTSKQISAGEPSP